jgi:hypothetical protein
MKRLFAAGALVLALSGCVSNHAAACAEGYADCDSQYQDGPDEPLPPANYPYQEECAALQAHLARAEAGTQIKGEKPYMTYDELRFMVDHCQEDA